MPTQVSHLPDLDATVWKGLVLAVGVCLPVGMVRLEGDMGLAQREVYLFQILSVAMFIGCKAIQLNPICAPTRSTPM